MKSEELDDSNGGETGNTTCRELTESLIISPNLHDQQRVMKHKVENLYFVANLQLAVLTYSHGITITAMISQHNMTIRKIGYLHLLTYLQIRRTKFIIGTC